MFHQKHTSLPETHDIYVIYRMDAVRNALLWMETGIDRITLTMIWLRRMSRLRPFLSLQDFSNSNVFVLS